ncbi:hypothetical protein V6N13_111973 [Hibiscus sabdariffa]
MSASVSTLGDSGWLIHVQSVLAGSAWIAARIALESASVLVHCSDGWDRTSQLVSLANLMLDPYYRTFAGFQALVEKDWLAFGHPFSDRIGLPSVPGTSFDLTGQSSTGSLSSSPARQSSGSFTPQASNSSHAQNNYSPIFLQWVDCVSQLLRMYPFAFEFSSTFLVDFLDCVLSCRFGNFLCNSEKERQQCGVYEACGCLWAYLADLRSSEGSSHAHYNLFYDPLKHNGTLYPPAAALAPTLWPQFHLRWSCPSVSQAGELEAECRNMAIKFSELQKAKEAAEMKAKEYSLAMETLKAELRNEKRLSSSAMNLAKRASKESAAIKRAIQSLGCRVNFTTNGDCIVDVESKPTETRERFMQSPPIRESDSTVHDDKSDLSVSITVVSDDVVSNSPLGQVCETLCPLRTRNGSCQWPNAGCAQLGSQFIGLKANFDAFDHLSIYDSYFEWQHKGSLVQIPLLDLHMFSHYCKQGGLHKTMHDYLSQKMRIFEAFGVVWKLSLFPCFEQPLSGNWQALGSHRVVLRLGIVDLSFLSGTSNKFQMVTPQTAIENLKMRCSLSSSTTTSSEFGENPSKIINSEYYGFYATQNISSCPKPNLCLIFHNICTCHNT